MSLVPFSHHHSCTMALLPETVLGITFSSWFSVILPFSIVGYWSLWVFYTRTFHPLASIPGPYWASISRTWYMYRIYIGDMDVVQRQLHATYGPIIRIAPNEVSTSEVSSIKQIYKIQQPLQKTDFYPVWGGTAISKQPDTFTCTDERVHSNYRRIVNPVYTLSNVLKSENYINRCSELFIRRLGEHADRNEAIDLGTWLQMYVVHPLRSFGLGSC